MRSGDGAPVGLTDHGSSIQSGALFICPFLKSSKKPFQSFDNVQDKIYRENYSNFVVNLNDNLPQHSIAFQQIYKPRCKSGDCNQNKK